MKTFAAIALLTATTGAFATEYTNFEIPASRLTRAEVRAAIGAPNPNGIVIVGDATQFVAPAGNVQRATASTAMADAGNADRINTRNASVLSYQPRSGRV